MVVSEKQTDMKPKRYQDICLNEIKIIYLCVWLPATKIFCELLFEKGKRNYYQTKKCPNRFMINTYLGKNYFYYFR